MDEADSFVALYSPAEVKLNYDMCKGIQEMYKYSIAELHKIMSFSLGNTTFQNFLSYLCSLVGLTGGYHQ